MGFSISMQDAAYSAYQAAAERFGGSNPFLRSAASSSAASDSDTKSLLRALDEPSSSVADMTGEQKKKAHFAYTGTLADKQTGYLDLWSASETKNTQEEEENAVTYNYKDVSADIQRAKTSSAAGSVVIKATRKVLEIKRKIASGKGDAEELAIALTHAKRMERVAKKKKHHLELEELVEHKQTAGLQEEDKESSSMASDAYQAAEDKLSDAEYKIEDMQKKALNDFLEENGLDDLSMDELSDAMDGMDISDITEMLNNPEMYEDVAEEAIPEEVMDGLNELLDEFAGEQLQMLEDMQEQLALMETVDPNMSKEDLDEMKMKHRQSERKEIVKADMDYLKDMFEHYEKKREKMLELAKASLSGGKAFFSGGQSFSNAVPASSASTAHLAGSGAYAAPAGSYAAASPAVSAFDISI